LKKALNEHYFYESSEGRKKFAASHTWEASVGKLYTAIETAKPRK